MSLTIMKGDITKAKTDAIVNAANSSLLGGGGVDGAIHRAAGPELLRECRTLNGCKTGEAKITGGYNLPAKHVIHTVGPIYFQHSQEESKRLLQNCYKNSMELAIQNNCKSVAFPLISAGVYGYPKEEALDVAVEILSQYKDSMELSIVLFDAEAFEIAKRKYALLTQNYKRFDNSRIVF
ncbi:MAG: O-acetyl-ADP-ribose deacetylase [Treponema sp.]|nr:O-acetyl-ADP-ribose deacetylase [Candidatus Treponema caballi]